MQFPKLALLTSLAMLVMDDYVLLSVGDRQTVREANIGCYGDTLTFLIKPYLTIS